MMRSSLVLPLALLLVACGGNTPPPQPPVAQLPPVGPAKPDVPPLPIEYIVLHRKWVEKFVATPAAEVKTWSDAPENAAAVSGSLRQIYISTTAGKDAAAAKKKAQGVLDRIKKGEDFAKLAKQVSEDTASKDSGGEYSSEKIKSLEEAVRTAFDALKPGETTQTLVSTAAGFYIVRKDRASDDQIDRAYRKAKAPEITKKLADDLLGRLKGNAESRPAIAEAVQTVLGESATSDVDRPTASIVERERLKQVRMTAAAKAALETFARSAHPGDLLPSPAVDGDTVVVARALTTGGGGGGGGPATGSHP